MRHQLPQAMHTKQLACESHAGSVNRAATLWISRPTSNSTHKYTSNSQECLRDPLLTISMAKPLRTNPLNSALIITYETDFSSKNAEKLRKQPSS